MQSHHSSLPSLADDKILPLTVVAEIADLSVPTLRRRIYDGTGPVITRLSPRRIGVSVRNLRTWLEARAENPSPSAAA